MIRPIIRKMDDAELNQFLEVNDGISIVEQINVPTIGEQVARLLQKPVTPDQLVNPSAYDDDEMLTHFLTTGEIPFGRLKSDDYFEAVDRQKLLRQKYEHLYNKKMEEEKIKIEEEKMINDDDSPNLEKPKKLSTTKMKDPSNPVDTEL